MIYRYLHGYSTFKNPYTCIPKPVTTSAAPPPIFGRFYKLLLIKWEKLYISLTFPNKLTSQQKQFADEYLIDLNASQAAIRAGYSERSSRSTASDLLNNKDIAKYISDKQRKVSDKLNWSFERIITRFADISDRCMQAEPVLDFEGNPTGEYRFDANAAIKATENIGKHIGFYGADNAQKATQLIADKITFK